MKHFIKLMLLAALALPGWTNAAAQSDVGKVQHQMQLESRSSREYFSGEALKHESVAIVEDKDAAIEFVSPETKGMRGGIASTRFYKPSSNPYKKLAPRKKADGNAPAIFVKVEETAASGGSSNLKYMPFDATYLDCSDTESQMIYTADKLSEMGIRPGAIINAFSFFVDTQTNSSGVPTELSQATYQVRVGLTESTSINSHNEMVSNRNSLGNPIFSGNLSSGATVITFTLSNPIIYEEGKSLIIDTYVSGITSSGTWTDCYWLGEVQSIPSCRYYYFLANSPNNQADAASAFLPKIQIDYEIWSSAEEIDFGAVLSGTTKTMDARINNPSEETMTANMSATQPFGVNPTTLSMEHGLTDFTLTFAPTQAINYTGKLNLDIDGHNASVDMKGVGYKPGEKAMRDSSFFAGIEYTWKENGVGAEHTSNLNQVATDPDQIIAMLTKVYTDPSIPGNLKRGFSASGTDEAGNIVNYPGVGEISHSGTDYSTGYSYEPSYGWDIPGRLETPVQNTSFRYYGNNSYATTLYADYCYMDSMQYAPSYDGLTLLLVETVDDFKYSTVEEKVNALPAGTSDYIKLRTQIQYTVKSARIISEAKRTTGASSLEAGTLFKIDADKLNKFFLLAKGQVRYIKNSWSAIGEQTSSTAFRANPSYFRLKQYQNSSSSLYEGFVDADTGDPFYHMFEQFSPVTADSEAGLDDVYQSLVNMQSFGVKHDCAGIPMMNHHFMMYGEDSDPDDCQDVRDLMFFVPDYRMLKFSSTENSGDEYNRDRGQLLKYLNYHPDHKPTLGLFVIRQNEIPEGTTIWKNEQSMTGLYKHQLSWKSNLDDFLPGDEQEYELWEVVVDEFGVESYQHVYYRNNSGEYTDADGNVVGEANKVPIVLNRVDMTDFLYTYVYVDMTAGSQTRTYVIRGRDKGHFLSLQMSNQEAIVIPGVDPNEKVHLIGATYYSRYNPDNEKNCYSNKLEMQNNALGLTESELRNNTLNFYRSTRAALVDGNGNPITDEDGNIQYSSTVNKLLFATGTVSGNTLTIELTRQSDKSEFPVGQTDGNTAGYHANNLTNGKLTFNFTIKNGYVDFGNMYFWDNFSVDVSKNAHPLQYLYRMEIGNAYSNNVRVPVYKTDSKINGVISLNDVLGDVNNNRDYAPGDAEFSEKVQLSSKTEILRYDAYRWPVKKENEHYYIVDEVGVNTQSTVDPVNEIESDIAPTGMAGNQGEWYTVSMNKVQEPEYYYAAETADQPTVSETSPTNWATFVDYYPQKQPTAGAYTYAPVVELFTKGYKEKLVNNKKLKRTDYNTYGGPLQTTAIGKLQVTPYKPTSADAGKETALMSNHKWQGENGKWYSYYNIYLNFSALDVPEGYQLYKVRAWRKMEKRVLGEQLETRAGRANYEGDWYMYEDMNFGDDLGLKDADGNPVEATMSKSELGKSGYLVGLRSTKIGKPMYPGATGDPDPLFGEETGDWAYGDSQNDAIRGEMRATFGALRLSTPELPTDFTELKATFKVRAYFTKNSNPLTGGNGQFAPIYVLGSPYNWSTSVPIAKLVSDDGEMYRGTVTFTEDGYFSFTNQLGNSWDEIWNHRLGVQWGNQDEGGNVDVAGQAAGFEFTLTCTGEHTKAFRVPAGTYDISLYGYTPGTYTYGQQDLAKVKITRASAKAPLRDGEEQAMPGSDYDYYVAESDEVTFTQTSAEGVVTGISAVKMDVNREVVGVSYVNTVGQVSSTPWQGVNMVVTRYSDGSTTTRKVIK